MRRYKTDKKRRISGHALTRYAQRVGPRSGIGRNVDAARAHGKQWFDLPPGPLQDFLRERTVTRSGRLVVYYKGYIYVFGAPKKSGPRDFITVYPFKEGEAKRNGPH